MSIENARSADRPSNCRTDDIKRVAGFKRQKSNMSCNGGFEGGYGCNEGMKNIKQIIKAESIVWLILTPIKSSQ